MYGRYVMMPPPPPPSVATLTKTGDFYYQQYMPAASAANSAQPPATYGNTLRNCYQNASGWTGVPLISNVVRRPKKPNGNGNNQNGSANNLTHRINSSLRHVIDYDENAMTRLVFHTQGAPLTQCNGRSRMKARKQPSINDDRTNGIKEQQQDYLQKSHECGQMVNNNNNNNHHHNNNSNNNGDGEHLSYESCTNNLFTVFNTSDESCNSSQPNQMVTSLPRIIKPRKRRKKERKPINNNNGMAAQDFRDTASSDGHVTRINDINSNNVFTEPLDNKIKNENEFMLRNEQPRQQQPPPPAQMNRDVNDINSITTNSSNLIDTISCSCRICDPFCKIWAFPLKKSCSDPTPIANRSPSPSIRGETNELGMTTTATDTYPNPDVGVIGSHRTNGTRSEWRTSLGLSPSNSSLDSKYGGNNEMLTRKSSFSDSGDSGCDILSGLNLTTDFLNNIDDISVIDSPTPLANMYGFVDAAFADTVNELSNDMINGMQFKCDFLPPAECLINVNIQRT